MSLLAVAQADGATPLAEMLVESGSRLRRGAVAVVITPSLDQSWVKPLASIRSAAVPPTACIVDPLAHLQATLAAGGQPQPDPTERQRFERDPLGDQLVSTRHRSEVVALR